MPTIQVTLDEDEIRKACERWVTHHVLNQGRALSSELSATTCHGKPTGTLNACTVWIETDHMQKST